MIGVVEKRDDGVIRIDGDTTNLIVLVRRPQVLIEDRGDSSRRIQKKISTFSITPFFSFLPHCLPHLLGGKIRGAFSE
jgi:hypothetical protein